MARKRDKPRRLYVVTVNIVKTAQIAVIARSAVAARWYMNNHTEWQGDAAFDEPGAKSFVVKHVDVQVADPTLVPFDGDVLCWNGDGDESVAYAFYGDLLNKLEPLLPRNATDEEHDAAWERYFEQEKALCAQFDTIQKSSV